jgi:multiple sugar transport system substrate-binding protein/putative aldouronate transport system substrate-binding protein
MKRYLACLLTLALLLTAFATVHAEKDDIYAKLDEIGVYDGGPITINVYSQLANYSGIQGHWSADLLLDMFNVRINIIPDSDGTYATRMESKNLGDIVVWGADGDQYQEAVRQGLLLDWEEDDLVQDYAPYIWENYQMALNANRVKSGDGKIHGFGHNVALNAGSHENFFYTWDLRWDLYKQLGYPQVKDLNGMIDLFRQMKEICPTDENGNPTYAVSLWPDWDGNMVMYVKSLATAYYGWDEFEQGLISTETGEFQGCLEPDGMYIECLRFFNTLYREGLLDPDSSSNTFDKMSEKVKAGGTFWSIFNFAGSSTYNTSGHMEAGRFMGTMVPDEATPICYGLSTAGGNRVWSIGADAEYPELCLAIIDYLATPEGSLTMWYGPKGLTWDYDAEGGTCFTELGLLTNKDPKFDMTGTVLVGPRTGKTYPQSGTYNDGALQINNTTLTSSQQNPDSRKVETLDKEGWVSVMNGSLTDIQLDWCRWSGCDTLQEYLENHPYKVMLSRGTYSASVMDSELKARSKSIMDAVKTYSWRCIYAKTDGEFNYHLNTMINECKAKGYDAYKDWCEKEAARCWAAQQELVAMTMQN